MRTAIDTNVLSALWSKEALGLDIARNLGNAKTEGGLVVGAPVYAELLAHPKATVSAAAKNWSTLAAECGPVGWLRSVE